MLFVTECMGSCGRMYNPMNLSRLQGIGPLTNKYIYFKAND